jgi:SnoaL-like protein
MLVGMERAVLQRWVERYEQLWRTDGTDELADLFTADATYTASPWAEPVQGLQAIAAFWDAERAGPDEVFALRSQVIAVDGDIGVVRVEVEYQGGRSWRDLWVLRLDPAGRCTAFEEWPFSPGQDDGHN